MVEGVTETAVVEMMDPLEPKGQTEEEVEEVPV